jgi:hypothetical protein
MMGVLYFAVCRDCKVYRDLDKFYTMSCSDVETRDDAIKFADEIKQDSFRAGLLVSFMYKHREHNCCVVQEQEPLTFEFAWDGEPDKPIKEDYDFWNGATNDNAK